MNSKNIPQTNNNNNFSFLLTLDTNFLALKLKEKENELDSSKNDEPYNVNLSQITDVMGNCSIHMVSRK